MKKIILLLIGIFVQTSYAIGPNEIYFNNIKFFKKDEKTQNYIVSSDYAPVDGKSSASITIMHVMGKNDPGKLAKGLKEKKSVEVLEVENIKPDQSDLLVSFVKFDTTNSKVENNLCRIKTDPSQKGCVIFQYIDTKRLKGQEGVEQVDFTTLSENMKSLPLDQYVGSLSQNFRGRMDMSGRLPWYKRPGAWAGNRSY